jgi:hypothetical protein
MSEVFVSRGWHNGLRIQWPAAPDRLANNNGRNVLAIVASQHYVVAVRVYARICPPWAFPP